ncbi:hypothetical protein GCM10009740_23630 [Terrabacter terrae]|uniref:Uncharacterized protein n=1 Tax=Terrabacter terrae TaxID=318434 RepID=A0ABN2U9B6_9MICO
MSNESDSTTGSAGAYDPDLDPDTDATMTAPEEGRPDGKGSAPDETTSGSADAAPQNPQNSDAAVLEAQEEEGPADE